MRVLWWDNKDGIGKEVGFEDIEDDMGGNEIFKVFNDFYVGYDDVLRYNEEG